MIIRQCIPADRENALSFLRAALPQDDAGDGSPAMDHRLSLIATEDDATLGVAVCHATAEMTEHRISVVAAAGRPDLVRTLLDKATLKLQAQGIHKFKIVLHEGPQPHALWEVTRWTAARPAPAEAPAKAAARKKKTKATPAVAAPTTH